jgi:hypothetical protein
MFNNGRDMLKMYLGSHVNNLFSCFDFSKIYNVMIMFGKILQFVISKRYDQQFLSHYVRSGGADMTSPVCFYFVHCVQRICK